MARQLFQTYNFEIEIEFQNVKTLFIIKPTFRQNKSYLHFSKLKSEAWTMNMCTDKANIKPEYIKDLKNLKPFDRVTVYHPNYEYIRIYQNSQLLALKSD